MWGDGAGRAGKVSVLGKGARLGGMGRTLAQQNKVGGVLDQGVPPGKRWIVQKWGELMS